ncbi:MAG: hypothetical protein KAJ48_10345 [Elusimicrobiales bacterium]|nr:hypothetical protein [Elusimicrobiales bacterium]
MIKSMYNRFFKISHNVQRLNKILQVLAKYGFGYFVDRLSLEESVFGKRIIPLKSIEKLDILNMSMPFRIRRVLEELGPAFIKLGQILSSRPDLIPLEFCEEFKNLQDNVSPFEYEKAKKLIEKELSAPIADLFNNFSIAPMAAASLAQVYSAELKSGEKVVIKVQRPNVEKIIREDLDLLSGIAKLIEKHIDENNLYNPIRVVGEFRKTILRETDFSIEARNIGRFRRNFENDDNVYAPKVFKDLSTKKILTMERIEGIRATDMLKLKKSNLDMKMIASNGANSILKQIFMDGFFHADPHSGNIFVLENNKIVFLDFGMVGRINEVTKDQISNILHAVMERDIKEIVEIFISSGLVDENVDVNNFELDMREFVEQYYEVPLKEMKMGQFLLDIIKIVSRNRIQVPPIIFLITKALVTIEDIGRKLDSDFNLTVHSKPFVETLVKRKYQPKKVINDIKKLTRLFYKFANSFPKDIALILSKIKKGTIKIEFEHKGLENLIHQMDKVSNRISFSVVVAALIIGSSIIMQSDKGAMLLGFPILGVIGFVVAGIMGLWLAIVILISGNL